MDMELRIILIGVGALIIIGLIIADQIKRKRAQELSYRRRSQDDEFDLPSMSTIQEEPEQDQLGELHIGDEVNWSPVAQTDKPAEPAQVVITAIPEDSAGEIDDMSIEPVLGSEPEPEPEPDQPIIDESGSEGAFENGDEVAEEAAAENGMVLSLLLLAPKGEKFRGTQLKMALKESGFSFGKMDIFHLLDGDEAVVSVANVLEPGFFDPVEMGEIKTPGVVIFSQLPSARSGGEVFEQWHRAIKKLNAALGGRLTDMSQQQLAGDYFYRLRAEAESYPASNIESAQDDSE